VLSAHPQAAARPALHSGCHRAANHEWLTHQGRKCPLASGCLFQAAVWVGQLRLGVCCLRSWHRVAAAKSYFPAPDCPIRLCPTPACCPQVAVGFTMEKLLGSRRMGVLAAV
jgi:hypothetical protein